ncbi:MAG: dephospho-CoA kinase [Gammaproteobacteria bacterium]|nr:dephospho-CoA kinase [Gammaproteobacteria bacterium]
MTYCVGLTGGIASGKSTVANLFARHGITIVDTDVIARQVVLPGQNAYEAILTYFGDFIVDHTGYLDRTKLREIIFKDKHKRLWLENLLHPLIRRQMIDAINEATSAYCIAVIPLLIETLPYPELNRILLVDVSVDTQIKRLKERDKFDEPMIKNILAAQIHRKERLAHADDVLINEGDLLTLTQAVDRLHKQYLRYSMK